MLPYIQIARPDHWFKNLFLLPGAASALLLGGEGGEQVWWDLFSALIIVCLTASANYTLNEVLDAPSDRHHPRKRERPTPRGLVSPRLAILQYVTLALISAVVAYFMGQLFFWPIVLFLLLGAAYNVRPVRTKDRPYFDIVSESANNPVRLLLGWAIVEPDIFPPASIVLVFWLSGAYLMTVKRYAEYRQIGDPEAAAKYRKSFAFYTEEKLLLSALFYAMNSAFFIAVFLLKYRIEFLISFPLISLIFAWYLAIGMQSESVAQTPERLYRQKSFLGFIAFTVVLFAILTVQDLPFLQFFLQPIQP